MIVPVANVQVGWINVAVGVAGVGGWALIVIMVPGEVHPFEFIALTVYVPGTTALNVTLD